MEQTLKPLRQVLKEDFGTTWETYRKGRALGRFKALQCLKVGQTIMVLVSSIPDQQKLEVERYNRKYE